MSIFVKQQGIWTERNVTAKTGQTPESGTFKQIPLSVKSDVENWRVASRLPLALSFHTWTDATLTTQNTQGPLANWLSYYDPKGVIEVVNHLGQVTRSYPYTTHLLGNRQIVVITNGEVRYRGKIIPKSNSVGFGFNSNSAIREIRHIDPINWGGVYPRTRSSSLNKVPAVLNPNIDWVTSAFQGCTVFDQDLTGWNTDAVVNWDNFRINSGLLTEHTPLKFR